MAERLLNSNHPVTIYISAAADLMAEREALGHIIAALPVTLPWWIVQSPLRDESLNLEAAQTADMYVLVLGSDIRAPVGLEWRTARRAGRPVAAFLKQGINRTPAGQAFVRETEVTWQPFTNSADLSQQVQHLLVEHLVRHALYYALTPLELEKLAALQKGAGEATPGGEGTGHSAVLLSRERFTPSEGILLER